MEGPGSGFWSWFSVILVYPLHDLDDFFFTWQRVSSTVVYSHSMSSSVLNWDSYTWLSMPSTLPYSFPNSYTSPVCKTFCYGCPKIPPNTFKLLYPLGIIHFLYFLSLFSFRVSTFWSLPIDWVQVIQGTLLEIVFLFLTRRSTPVP